MVLNDKCQERDHLRTVRHATDEDLAQIVGVHLNAFPHFFLTRLGGRCLLRYYAQILRYRTGIVLVSERMGLLEGFVCGFVGPADFYKLMWHNRHIFVRPVLSALVRHPSLATGIVNGIQRIRTSASETSIRRCELASIAVTPKAGGNGLGMTLLKSFIAQAWTMDALTICLTTDAKDNDLANALYAKAGFHKTRCFLQRNRRWMNEYVMERTQTKTSMCLQ